jgi:hypothetical protein
MNQLNHDHFVMAFEFLKENNPERVIETEVVDGFANGTGYMNGGVYHALKLKNGENAIGMDSKGRRVMLHKTPNGNVCIFERYTDGANGVLVWNTPSSFWDSVFGRVGLTIEQLGFTLSTYAKGEEVPEYVGSEYTMCSIGHQLIKEIDFEDRLAMDD